MTAFRRAGPDDVPALHALIERAYRGDSARAGWTHEADLLDGQRTDPAALAAMLGDPAQTILIREDHGALIACVSVRRLAGGVAYVGLVTVDPAIQARGLGRAALDAAENDARHNGATCAEMTVIAQRAELIAWYERRGWRPSGERRPFPLDDPRVGVPRTRALDFVVLEKMLEERGRGG